MQRGCTLWLLAALTGCGQGAGVIGDAAIDAARGAQDAVVGDDAGASAVDGSTAPCEEGSAACGYPSRGLALAEPVEAPRIMDARTGRALPLVVRAPREGGPYPVVLFEHGGELRDGGEREHQAWGNLLASHGYVVLHLGHPPVGEGEAALCRASGATESECRDDPAIVYAAARVFDQLAALERVAAMAGRAELGGVRLDVSRVAVAGWSGGTHGTVTVHGATRALSPSVPRFSQTSAVPRAVVLLSPSGAGFHHFYADGANSSWSTLRGAVLVATGQNDVKPDLPDLTGPLRRQPFDLAPADGSRWLLFSQLAVGVGGHGTYNLGDSASTDPRLRRLSSALSAVTLAFLDMHLRDSAAARAYLQSDAPRRLAGEALWSAR